MSRKNLLAGLWLVCVPALFAENIPGRYIVELSTEPVAEHVARLSVRDKLHSAVASTQRARIRTEQQQVRQRVEQQQAVVLDSVDTIANALLVSVPDNLSARLAALPGVKRVLPVRTMHLFLDRAVILHRISDAWNQIGTDQAGAGVKIAIIDTGIENTHPAFQDSSLPALDGFPKLNRSSDAAYTNSKIIVARSYVSLLPNRDPDLTAMDHIGHGTALAMTTSGVRVDGPLATIAGVAPKSYVGNYKVFGTPGFNDSTAEDAVIKAMDDAVADGMDIINLSLGDDLAPRLADDISVQAVERASKAGVIVVVSAGNNGPDLNTMGSPATAPSAIAVGAVSNDRTFAASLEVPGLASFVALTGSAVSPSASVSGTFTDVAALDGTGLACSSLPSGSLRNSIALILRGSCTFESKLNNAQLAGAVAAIVYAAQSSPDPVAMAVGQATLPAEMIGYDDGIAIKQSLASQSALSATLHFTLGPVRVSSSRVTDFSAAGPNVDLGIKPDLLAVGSDFYTATQTLDPSGEMYDPSGFILVDGTSFSAPLVAGTAALIKSARPGLTVDQYRSLLINTASDALSHTGWTPKIQQSGAGLLDANAALHSTVTAYPVSISFGAGSADAVINRTLTLTNAGSNAETFTIAVNSRSDAVAPAVSTSTVALDPGASIEVPIAWNTLGLSAGTYEGFVAIMGSSSGTEIRVPYWYAAPSDTPATVVVLDTLSSARRGSVQKDAVLFRITDVSGLNLTDLQPQVTVVSGGGTVRGITTYDNEVPGLFGIDVQLGAAAGANVFRIQAGSATTDISITGQ